MISPHYECPVNFIEFIIPHTLNKWQEDKIQLQINFLKSIAKFIQGTK
jgi:hypothetical protein